ncbi:MAG TPA: hypothetical protein VGN16_04815 [Acidobacteriaceae bacterium]
MARLLDSPYFSGSPSIAKTLAFCVNSTLAGDESALKETTIGISCFGRDPGYDTKLDPIVRVTIRRMRKKLELFYTGEGKDESIRIVFPKGSYIPRFEDCERQDDEMDKELLAAPVDADPLTKLADDIPVTESIPQHSTPEKPSAYLMPWYLNRRVQGVTAFLSVLLVMVLADLRGSYPASAFPSASNMAGASHPSSETNGTFTQGQNRNQLESNLLPTSQSPELANVGDAHKGRGGESALAVNGPALVAKLDDTRNATRSQNTTKIVRVAFHAPKNAAIAAIEEIAKVPSGRLSKGANDLEVAGLRKVGAKVDLSPWVEPRL